jgi:cyclopropane fatty-acyl-phospholipid synthase-like methyltransferase
MEHKVELFYDAYKDHADELYTEIREDTYGEDIGQNSWLTADEYRGFFNILQLSPNQKVLEVATGSGGPAVFMVKETGCRLMGIDINEHGIQNAKKLAAENGVESRTEFILADASEKFPFPDASFDTIVSIDSINHFKNRDKVFLEFNRMLKNGGCLLFTDAVVITGILTSEEIAIRSSLGFFLFVPKGENERLLKEAGFREIVATDVTENIITTSLQWYNAREKRKARLLKFEDEAKFESVQSFFRVTHTVSSEKRLSRFMYTAVKKN